MLLHNKFKLEFLGDSIIRITPKLDVDLEVEDVKEMREMLVRLSKGNKYCVLLDATERFNVSADARALIAGKEFSFDRIATAFIITSLANMLVGNFFIKVNKPYTPTKIFSSEENALSWLKSEVKKVNDRIFIQQ